MIDKSRVKIGRVYSDEDCDEAKSLIGSLVVYSDYITDIWVDYSISVLKSVNKGGNLSYEVEESSCKWSYIAEVTIEPEYYSCIDSFKATNFIGRSGEFSDEGRCWDIQKLSEISHGHGFPFIGDLGGGFRFFRPILQKEESIEMPKSIFNKDELMNQVEHLIDSLRGVK